MSGWIAPWAAVKSGTYESPPRTGGSSRALHAQIRDQLELQACAHARKSAWWLAAAPIAMLFAFAWWPMFFLGAFALASWAFHRSEAKLSLRLQSVPFEED